MPRDWRGKYGNALAKADLLPLPKQLAHFLGMDLVKIRTKHVGGTKAEPIMHMATFLDPRWKAHPCLDASARACARKDALAWAFEAHELSPLVVEMYKKRAAHPDSAPLASLAAAHPRRRSPRIAAAAQELPKPTAPQGMRPPRQLRPKKSVDEFFFGPDLTEGALETGEMDVKRMLEEEVVRYEALPPIQRYWDSPLAWWKGHAHTMPHLAVVTQ